MWGNSAVRLSNPQGPRRALSAHNRRVTDYEAKTVKVAGRRHIVCAESERGQSECCRAAIETAPAIGIGSLNSANERGDTGRYGCCVLGRWGKELCWPPGWPWASFLS
jgi:hypothetical protein